MANIGGVLCGKKGGWGFWEGVVGVRLWARLSARVRLSCGATSCGPGPFHFGQKRRKNICKHAAGFEKSTPMKNLKTPQTTREPKALNKISHASFGREKKTRLYSPANTNTHPPTNSLTFPRCCLSEMQNKLENRFVNIRQPVSKLNMWAYLPRLAKNWISLVVARNQVLHMQQCL